MPIIAQVLDILSEGGSVFTFGQAFQLPAKPTIALKGVGPITLPVNDASAKSIINVARKTFWQGRGDCAR